MIDKPERPYLPEGATMTHLNIWYANLGDVFCKNSEQREYRPLFWAQALTESNGSVGWL